MKEKLRLGVIGTGKRGSSLLRNVVYLMDDIDVYAICDTNREAAEKTAAEAESAKGRKPKILNDYNDLLNLNEIDVILVTGGWNTHIPAAIAAMKAGKAVGCEVGCAETLEQCHELVRVHEETGVQCCMIENCCYGRNELMVLNMARQRVFGKIVHVSGGYHHDLRNALLNHYHQNNGYRLKYYISRNGDNYPTHELGPLAVLLKLGRGNRMEKLSSFSSPSAGIQDLITRKYPDYEPVRTLIRQGDIITTVITCANGETIVLTLDTSLPRAYSRGYTVRGTRGMYQEDSNSIFLDDEGHDHNKGIKAYFNNAENYRTQYEHPIWQKFLSEGIRGGHDGMDWLVLRRFFDAVKESCSTPLDAYDMASWMSIYPLTEMSIARGGMPVDVPDFTNGKWMWRKDDWLL